MTTYRREVDLQEVELEDDGSRLADDAADRRSATRGPRTSWASSQPFVLPVRSDAVEPLPGDRPARPLVLDPVSSATARRNSWARPLATRALAGDATITVVVWALVSATLDVSTPARLLTAASGLLAAALWCALLWCFRAYDSRRIGTGPEEFSMVGRAALTVLALAALFSYAFKLDLPRRFVLLALPLIALAVAVHRHLARRRLHRQRRQGQALMRTLVVGTPSAVDDVVRDLSSVSDHGYDVVGACVPSTLIDVALDGTVKVVGTLSDVPQVVVDRHLDVVIVAGAGLSSSSLRRLAWALERTGADLVVAPGLVEVTGPRVQMRPAAGLSLLHVEAPESFHGRMLGKALLDRTLGAGLFLGSLLVLVPFALAVKTTSAGPAFFRQERIGRDGKPFTMWKLRSMVAAAEAMRTDELLADSDRDGLMFKMRADPRITKVGAIMRRYSIDELPQLWNVVRGDMSLVGPRPPLREEYDRYHDAVHRRLRVKPGLTGLWQVSGRADLSWEESIRLDLRYVDNWSVAFDAQILWKTARAVLLGSGAY